MKDLFEPFDPMKDSQSTLPDIPGNYLIVLRKSSELPQIEIVPELHYIAYNNIHYPVVYTGISTKSIRKRDYKQHFTGNNAGKSTLRKSLGSLMGFSKIPRDKSNPQNGKTKFNIENEEKLSQWMKENLLVFHSTKRTTEEIETYEKELIQSLNPPLNIKSNTNPTNKGYRDLVRKLRADK